MSTDLTIRETLPALVACYRLAEEEIGQAYDLLESAEKRLQTGFQDFECNCFNANPRDYCKVGSQAADMVMETIKREAWRVLIERMELRRVLSVKRRKELDEQLRNGDRLPEITEENIVAMLQDNLASIDSYMKEAIQEVFDFLRPVGSELKTNSEFELGKRVILHQVVSPGYLKGSFRVAYQREPELTALDNVFSVCDGKGTIKTYRGPLCDGISESRGGVGVGRLDGDACSACRMSLPMERIRALEEGPDVAICPQCRRLIVVRTGEHE